MLQILFFSITCAIWVYTLGFFSTKFYNTLEYLLDEETPLYGIRYFTGMSVLIVHFLLVLVSAGVLLSVLQNSNL